VPDPRAPLDPRDPDPEVRRRLRAWLALQELGALLPAEAVEALQRERDVERAARRLAARPGVPPLPERGLLDARIARLARIGAVALPLGHPSYPPRIRRLPDPAPLLWVRGELRALTHPNVALVGSRRASAAGREAARALAAELAELGFAVTSGLARGIDAAAHCGALDAGGLSLAVLGCGIDLAYPPEHAELAERIAASGALVSELPPGAPPRKHHFPLRNRLISGLAAALVVVEARERSGSLITAAHALAQGSEVLAVPGPVRVPGHLGSNRLLRDGAWPALDADDVLRALRLPTRESLAADPRAAVCSPSEREVFAALLDEPATPDQLARRLGRTPEALALDLVELELAGRVGRERDGRLVARAAARTARAKP
jgi:DNA processing protein